MTATPVLEAAGLRVRRGAREVVAGVDLSLDPGEVVVVLGPNGAGKSTLLAALAGTLPPAAGTVTRRGRVAQLLQTPALAARSARGNVELALQWWGDPRAGRRARADDALRRMRADHLAGRFAPGLSGGEQRRVHLARAVAVRPDVLLLDEPFDGLDPTTRVALRDDTVDAVRATGAALLVVLHDRADAWALADRLLVVVGGTVAGAGAPAELLAAPPTADVARLLGWDGEVTAPGLLRLCRSAATRLVPPGSAGGLAGTVRRVTPAETANRLRVDVPGGVLGCDDPDRAVRPGDEVTVQVSHWAEFAN